MPADRSHEPTGAGKLDGRGVVVTRPREQARELIALVEAAGGWPIVFPALEIEDVAVSDALRALVARLEMFDFAVFVSPTAAARGLALIRHVRGSAELPRSLRCAAVGEGTARALRRLGVPDVLVPESGADSEALAALPELLELRGRSVVIFRGVGGRELLADTLRARGGRVEYAECYRRVRPRADVQTLARAWAQGEIDAVTVTSREGLENLLDMLDVSAREAFRRTPLFVPHERIAEAARSLGIPDVIVTGSGDEALVAALVRYFAARPVE